MYEIRTISGVRQTKVGALTHKHKKYSQLVQLQVRVLPLPCWPIYILQKEAYLTALTPRRIETGVLVAKVSARLMKAFQKKKKKKAKILNFIWFSFGGCASYLKVSQSDIRKNENCVMKNQKAVGTMKNGFRELDCLYKLMWPTTQPERGKSTHLYSRDTFCVYSFLNLGMTLIPQRH